MKSTSAIGEGGAIVRNGHAWPITGEDLPRPLQSEQNKWRTFSQIDWNEEA